MPHNVGALNEPKKEFDEPVSVYGEPQKHYKIYNHPNDKPEDTELPKANHQTKHKSHKSKSRGPYNRDSNPFEQFRKPRSTDE